ncbi:MAG: ATP-binding protein [Prolixibacteraceae bacterium]|jgi:NadR type nicotinamide-nucleotide adenylyltransferase|nr:ATP-binding protein [Prolixibacteraceae bacterium]
MNDSIKIVLTGAESTGKSTLAQGLSEQFNGIYVPELARSYIENLQHKYTYTDIEEIARLQIEKEKGLHNNQRFIFFDTWLIITKVWFDFVYGKHPYWLHQAISKSNIGLFIVCDIDIPWMEDPVRENGGENRQKLHNIYISELEAYNFNYKIVSGNNNQRLQNATDIVNDFLKTKHLR